MPFVLDACAMIAYLQGEKGSSLVRQLLLDEDCMAHAVNLCEVFYDYLFILVLTQNDFQVKGFRLTWNKFLI